MELTWLVFWLRWADVAYVNDIALTSVETSDWLYTLKPAQNGCHFAGNIFKSILLCKNCGILIKIEMKFNQMDFIWPQGNYWFN